jgi:hypothetical protein
MQIKSGDQAGHYNYYCFIEGTFWSCDLEAFFQFLFSGRTSGLGGRSAHRQPQGGSTVLLQIQRVSYGEPPTPSVSDLTLELDQY